MARVRPDLAKMNVLRARHRMTKTPTWKSWEAMRDRCGNPKSKDWPRYGGRGIKVCPSWQSFDAFFADMGVKPDGMTLDRIDTNGDYCKENCRWATPEQQARNRRSNVVIEFQGQRKTVSEWAEQVGIERKTLEYRIRVGWSPDRALTTPSLINRKN